MNGVVPVTSLAITEGTLVERHLYFIAELSNDSYSTVALGGEEGSPAGGGGAGATGGARYAATPPYLRTHSPPHPHYHYPPDHLVYTNIGKWRENLIALQK